MGDLNCGGLGCFQRLLCHELDVKTQIIAVVHSNSNSNKFHNKTSLEMQTSASCTSEDVEDQTMLLNVGPN
jgi:hypothetical protein